MAHTNNMRPFVVHIPFSNDKALQIPSSLQSTSTSTAPSNFSSSYDNFTYNHCKCDSARNSHQVALNFLPSPPPTNSDPKRSVPLPSLGSNAEAGPSSPVSSRCRHYRRLSLGSTTKSVQLLCFPALVTPPPTIPTQTLALPPPDADMVTDLELSPIPNSHDDWGTSLLGLPSASSFPDQENSMDHLLSPMSPEWITSGTYDMAPSNSNTTSILLGGRRIPDPESLPYLQESDGNNNNTSPQCRPSLHHLDIPFSPPNATLSDSPTPSPMDLAEDLLPTPNTPNMDLDLHVPSTPKSLPASPFVHEITFPPDARLYDHDFRGEKYLTFFEPPPVSGLDFLPELDDIPDSPSSPLLRSFSSLPSLYDDDFDGFTSPPPPGATLIPLPDADPEEDEVLFPPDPDRDLPPGVPASPFGSSTGNNLLLLEDETLPRSPSPENCDVVDPVYIEDSVDPDVRRLGELRRRSLHAEQAARQLEQTLLEQGAVHQRWEARRARKKEKERGREIGAMLRLKMAQEKERERKRLRAEGDMMDEEREEEEKEKEKVVKKDAISSMEQLVAKMLFRRNDTYRSLANRKTPLTSKFRKSSPLVRCGDSVGVDIEGGHEHGSLDLPPLWTSNSDSESESGPRTLSAWTSPLPQSFSSSF